MPARRAFSLIELVIVTVVVGVIAAVAAPRLSLGSEGSSNVALARDLQALRKAVDLYAAEHGGKYPSVAEFKDQLKRYTDAAGTVSKEKTGSFIYGPYLNAIPKAAAGPSKGSSKVAADAGAGVGWIYDEATGELRVNGGNAVDAVGRPYSDY